MLFLLKTILNSNYKISRGRVQHMRQSGTIRYYRALSIYSRGNTHLKVVLGNLFFVLMKGSKFKYHFLGTKGWVDIRDRLKDYI